MVNDGLSHSLCCHFSHLIWGHIAGNDTNLLLKSFKIFKLPSWGNCWTPVRVSITASREAVSDTGRGEWLSFKCEPCLCTLEGARVFTEWNTENLRIQTGKGFTSSERKAWTPGIIHHNYRVLCILSDTQHRSGRFPNFMIIAVCDNSSSYK